MGNNFFGKALFEYDSKRFLFEDFINTLGKVGLAKGDNIFVHSDLGHFGKIADIRNRDDFADAFISGFREVIGPCGNMIVPTFSYTFCKGEVFDPDVTPSTIGILPEVFRKKPEAIRSHDAIFSVSAIGPENEFFTDVGNDCFGAKSIFEKIHQRNVKIVFLGNTFDITYMHYVEQGLKIPYRFIKEFKGTLKTNTKSIETSYLFNVRPLEKDIDYDLEGIAEKLRLDNVLRQETMGFSKVRVVTGVEAFQSIHKGLMSNVRYLQRDEVGK